MFQGFQKAFVIIDTLMNNFENIGIERNIIFNVILQLLRQAKGTL